MAMTKIEQAERIKHLELESKTKSDLITAQLALGEERNEQIAELQAALTEAQTTIEAQAKELATLRGLLELDPETGSPAA